MQLTLSTPNKKGKHFLKTTRPNKLPKAEKMPPAKHRRKTREPKLHKLADKLTEILIYFIIIFSPWAFGTTEQWSIWTMNISACALGILLVTKLITRLATKYNPNPEPDISELSPKQNRLRLIQKTCTILLAGSMFLLLAYILTSAINARASFNFASHEYTYFERVNKDLPHSYDANATWNLFWKYQALIILFWSTRDWLSRVYIIPRSSFLLNQRVKRLLFLISINGGILALTCIFQRIYYGNEQGKLIFLIEPFINISNISQFGPFAYRSNAAAYFNIIWPLILGMFIQIGKLNFDKRKYRLGSGSELILIPCIVITASCPIISSSRGGSIVMIGLLILSTFSMLYIKSSSKFFKLSILASLLICLLTAYNQGWEKLEPRLLNIFTDNMNNRDQIYNSTYKMIEQYPIYGSGPGTFETIAQFEITEDLKSWQSWVHNDYLEFYLTFGIPGGLIIITIVIIFTSKMIFAFFQGKTDLITRFGLIAVLGLLIHAYRDFPLQVYSIQIIFIILCSLYIFKGEKHIKI